MFSQKKAFCVFLLALCIGCVASSHHRRTRRSRRFLLRQLKHVRNSVDDLLTKYIISEMNCARMSECRESRNELVLINLPHFKNNQESESWNITMKENLKSLHKYGRYLNQTVLTSPTSKLIRLAGKGLNEVTNLLFQFEKTFKANVEKTCRVDLEDLHDHVPSPHIRTPPSQIIEVVRDHQFLIQFFDFLNDFYRHYRNFFHARLKMKGC